MALNYVGSRNGSGRSITEPIVIKTGDTIAVGDAVVTYTAGIAEVPTAAEPFRGIVVALTDSNGVPLAKGTRAAGSADTSDVSSDTGDGTQYVQLDTNVNSIYSAQVNGTIGTTNSSNLQGAGIDIDSANTDYGRVLETTAVRAIGTPTNFYSYGTDPRDSTRLLVSIALSEETSVYE